MPDHQVDEALEQQVHLRAAPLLRRRAVHQLVQVADARLGHRLGDLRLRLEVVVDGGLGDPQRVGDHLQRRALDPVFGEQAQRRLQQSGPGVLGRAGGHSSSSLSRRSLRHALSIGKPTY